IIVNLPDGSTANAYIKQAPDGSYYNFTYSTDENAVGTYRSAGADGITGTADDGPLVDATGVGARLVDYLNDLYSYDFTTGLYSEGADGYWDYLLLEEAGFQFSLSTITEASVALLNQTLGLTGASAYGFRDFIDLDGDGNYDFVLDKPTLVDGQAVYSPEAVLLYLRDGYWGDFDGMVNAQIVDPGGPGNFIPRPAPPAQTNTPTVIDLNQALASFEPFSNEGTMATSAGVINAAPSLSELASDVVFSGSELPEPASGIPSTFERRLMQEAREALHTWAQDSGLGQLGLGSALAPAGLEVEQPGPQTPGGSADGAALRNRDLAALGPHLLEALALGAAGLYATQLVGQNRLESLARQWLRNLKTKRQVVTGHHNQVISIFVVRNSAGVPKLVAAQILDDAIEILAEQPLAIKAPHGTALAELDLSPAINCLQKALSNQQRDHQPLLLIDPQLESHLGDLGELSSERALLHHSELVASLKALNQGEQDLMRQWLNQPTQTDVTASAGCQAVMQQLAKLQQRWAEHMPTAMANVAGVLDLSLALGHLQNDYSAL
ncbi:MAG: hypothetical protein ACO27O_10240, partial [Hylemonella sp.]